MRAPLFIVAASLALAACSNNDNRDNTQNVDENLTAENIVSNDVTAIDAVTGDDANMAADAAITDIGNAPADQGNASAFPKPKPETVTPSGSSGPKKPAPSPVDTTSSNSAGNAAD